MCSMCLAVASGAEQGWDLHEERLGASAGALGNGGASPTHTVSWFFGDGIFWHLVVSCNFRFYSIVSTEVWENVEQISNLAVSPRLFSWVILRYASLRKRPPFPIWISWIHGMEPSTFILLCRRGPCAWLFTWDIMSTIKSPTLRRRLEVFPGDAKLQGGRYQEVFIGFSTDRNYIENLSYIVCIYIYIENRISWWYVT